MAALCKFVFTPFHFLLLVQACRRRGCHGTHILTDQLTLSQPGGQIMPTTLLLQNPQDFQTFLRPWTTYYQFEIRNTLLNSHKSLLQSVARWEVINSHNDLIKSSAHREPDMRGCVFFLESSVEDQPAFMVAVSVAFVLKYWRWRCF